MPWISKKGMANEELADFDTHGQLWRLLESWKADCMYHVPRDFMKCLYYMLFL